MTTVTDRVQVESMAMFAWLMLPESDRFYIARRLDELAKLAPDEWPEPEVRPLQHQAGIWLLESQNDFRVFFRREADGKLTVRDIVIQALIDLFASQKAEAAT